RAWEIRRNAWRFLRHNRAIAEFHCDLHSDNFINPPQRTQLFHDYKAGQLQRHDTRLKLLRRLGALRP
ncbi:unnamed protein product, partial [Choristocarpus tenellus]